MRLVTAEEIDRALTFPALVDALAEAFRGETFVPTRHHHEIGRPGDPGRTGDPGTLLLMPAWSAAGGGFLGVKVVSVFPGNGARGLPSVLGTYLLMDGDTGRPLAALDGTRLTLWRTAAVSALAARYLAREDTGRMTMVGAGNLAPFLIRAHMSQRPIRDVRLWNHRGEKATALATAFRDEGLPVEAAPDLEAACRDADLISCATLSRAPLVQGGWLKDGSHLDLVGAFNLLMREADDAAMRRAEIFVDTPAALDEGGDVALGVRSGAIAKADVRGDLAALCRGEAAGRTGERAVTLFKSVGTALADLASATAVWRAMGEAA